MAAAGKQLQLARETALAAKCRVVVVRGVLYYGRSSALEDAEALLDPYAVPSPDAQGVCAALDVRWLWPTISKEVVQERFAAFGAIKSVQLSAPTWGPKTGLRIAEKYNIATVTYLAKASAVAARRALGGASVFLNGAANIHDPILVRFAGVSDDDDDDANDCGGGGGGGGGGWVAGMDAETDDSLDDDLDELDGDYDDGI